jgi:uncharacterized protein YukE
VSGLAWPAGDPGLLDELADALDRQAGDVTALAKNTGVVMGQVRSEADWAGQAANAYTEFTGQMAHGIELTAPPLSQIASAVRGYASSLRLAQAQVTAYNGAVSLAQANGHPAAINAALTAQAQAEQACAACQSAGDQAAAQVHAATGDLRGVFSPDGDLRGTIELIHTLLGAVGADGILWGIGEGAEQTEKFMKELPEEEAGWLHDRLASLWGQEAPSEDWAAAISGWWTKADAAESFGQQAVDATKVLGVISKAGRLVGGPIAIAGDISTIVSPPQSGAMGDVDRGTAAVNGTLIGIDTAGALGSVMGIEGLAALTLPGVGVGIVVATGFYLAGAYAYKHFAWFRQDLAKPIGHAVVDSVKEMGRGAADIGHDIASLF